MPFGEMQRICLSCGEYRSCEWSRSLNGWLCLPCRVRELVAEEKVPEVRPTPKGE